VLDPIKFRAGLGLRDDIKAGRPVVRRYFQLLLDAIDAGKIKPYFASQISFLVDLKPAHATTIGLQYSRLLSASILSLGEGDKLVSGLLLFKRENVESFLRKGIHSANKNRKATNEERNKIAEALTQSLNLSLAKSKLPIEKLQGYGIRNADVNEQHLVLRRALAAATGQPSPMSLNQFKDCMKICLKEKGMLAKRGVKQEFAQRFSQNLTNEFIKIVTSYQLDMTDEEDDSDLPQDHF